MSNGDLYSWVYSGGYTVGHAATSYWSNYHHGWVCDDRADGYPVYADFYFKGIWGDTQVNKKAPAHGHGCGDWHFKKEVESVQVYWVDHSGHKHYGPAV